MYYRIRSTITLTEYCTRFQQYSWFHLLSMVMWSNWKPHPCCHIRVSRKAASSSSSGDRGETGTGATGAIYDGRDRLQIEICYGKSVNIDSRHISWSPGLDSALRNYKVATHVQLNSRSVLVEFRTQRRLSFGDIVLVLQFLTLTSLHFTMIRT